MKSPGVLRYNASMPRRFQFSLRRPLVTVSILAGSVASFRATFGFHFEEAMFTFFAAICSAGLALGLLINRPTAGLLIGACAGVTWNVSLILLGHTP